MPNFTNSAPEKTSGQGLRLCRTPAVGHLVGLVTCPQLIGCPTHFYHYRTVPCEAPDCEACQAGQPWRWHGYVSAIDQATNEHILFEMTAQAAENFTGYHERHGTLIGCLFEAKRLSQHTNGRVLIRCKPTDLANVHMPPAPNMINALSHIWNIPTPQFSFDGLTKKNPRIVIQRNVKGNSKPTTAPVT